ncbi:GyrI-like domain-containing protein [Lacticaseibacillus zhaodongensis]|uniref:GyrI-like domain-containing protein n=1 Tax=Lacticaseibacillus zhaodongensis TaxID=2668065 RepID=UPI0012D2BC6E|nr:GyrI-like domain-containing protein [Lacticaseibacillus zhaodongensis]
MSKYEWRKKEKSLYFPKQPEVCDLPAQKYITIDGVGNPNDSDFSEHISALYPVAYGIRMALKRGELGEPFEYTVYPLEGIWTTSDGSRGAALNKDALVYRIMIKQPDRVTSELFTAARDAAFAKKQNPLIQQVQFANFPAEKVVQAMHVGSFDTEGATFAAMESFAEEHHLTRIPMVDDFQHREVYISDFRKTAAEKLKTLLRFKVTETK